MAQFLFTLLAIFSGTSIGAATYTTWTLYRLRNLTGGNRRRWYLYMMLVNLGVIGTFGTLLVVIVPTAQVVPAPRAWFYICSLAVAAYGLIGLSAVTADELASAESRTDEMQSADDETIREARTSEDKQRASLRGWEDDSRFGDEPPKPEP